MHCGCFPFGHNSEKINRKAEGEHESSFIGVVLRVCFIRRCYREEIVFVCDCLQGEIFLVKIPFVFDDYLEARQASVSGASDSRPDFARFSRTNAVDGSHKSGKTRVRALFVKEQQIFRYFAFLLLIFN